MFQVQELIDRAKTYVDDEHRAEDAWISPTRWLTFFNTERRKLYKQWIRAGLIRPPVKIGHLQGLSTSFTGVLAVIGVAKDLGGSLQHLPNAAEEGRSPFWRPANQPSTPGSKWVAFGEGTTVTIELDGASDLVVGPDNHADGYLDSNYIVRYITALAIVTDPTTSIDLPDGGDERLVLGMARRALIKEAGALRRLDQEIIDSEAEINLQAHAATGGMKMRQAKKGIPLVPVSPNRWIYFG